MTKIYIAIWDDRHSDVTVHAFSNKNSAVEWGREIVCDYDPNNTDQPLTEDMKRDGWVYYGVYSCEGDNIRVVEVVLDSEIANRT